MDNFLLRWIFRLGASKVPTSMLRWSDIRHVSVVVNAEAPDAAEAAEKARALFAGKAVDIVNAKAKVAGRIRKDTQVLVSLLPQLRWRPEYAIRHSKAVFKVGRTPLDVFDLVVSDPEGSSHSQTEVLGSMVQLMKNLQ